MLFLGLVSSFKESTVLLDPQPSSESLARYLEERGELGKPWNLQMLRLKKLKEQKETMDPQEYIAKIQEAHADLMRLGKLWKGREAEVFKGVYASPSVAEPLPGSPEEH